MHNKSDINWIVSYLEGSVFDGKRLKKNWDELIDENAKLKASLDIALIDLKENIKINKELSELNREYERSLLGIYNLFKDKKLDDSTLTELLDYLSILEPVLEKAEGAE